MKILFRFLVLGSLIAVVSQPGRVLAAPVPSLAQGNAASYVPGEVLVKFRSSVAPGERNASIAERSGAFLADLGLDGWTRVRIGSGQMMNDALAAYENDPNVEYAQPNYLYSIAAAPNDPSYGQLWAYRNTGQTILNTFTQPPLSALTYTLHNPGISGNDMNIEKAWDHITDCSTVVVAVVDTGVNYSHTDLQSSMWSSGTDTWSVLHGFNAVDFNNDPMDLHGHGTHVAGIIGASGDNATGTTGVCWKASIMAVRVLDATGLGSTADIIKGIGFAVAHGAKVINMSLGGTVYDPLFNDAITAAQAADVVVVVAAGNSGRSNDTTPTYPCNFTQPNLICVAALDQAYGIATFSNYGRNSVDVGAPGTNILSDWAGTAALITDPLSSGWTFSTTTSGGWAFGVLTAGVPTNFLLDPPAYPNGRYHSSTDDRAYRSFDLTGVDVAVGRFWAALNIINGDYFRVACKGAGGDPFGGGGSTVLAYTDWATFPNLVPLSVDLSNCISATSSVGFQLQSTASGTKDLGIAVMAFGIATLALNTTSYNTIDGTSMATPEAAGLATMLRAYNPQFTAIDTVKAIKNGGRPTASLSGKTSTGRAIDVMASLSYINPPSGLSVSIQ